MAGENLLLMAGAMFAVLALAGALAGRVGQSVIPFYVVGGAVVSEFVLGSVGLPALPADPEPEFVTVMAELGIVFLLFFLGLEFSIDRLLESRRKITSVGLLDLAVNLPIGVAIGLLLGWSVLEALLLGGIVYISSSAVITKSLIDLGWIANAESEPMLGTLVFEDLFIALYLAVLSAVLAGSGSTVEIATDVGIAMGFLVALVAVVYFGDRLFERLLAVDSQEATVLRTVAAAVLVGGVALGIGVSEAVAAFFVGMGFSSTGHVHDIEELLSPVRDVFAAVFFFWIGLTTDPRLVVAGVGLLAVLVVATTPTKLLSGFYSGRLYGLDDRRSVRVATGMVTRGEFSLVIAAVAASAGTSPVMRETIPALAVGYVLVMSILGTTLMQSAGRFEGLLVREKADST